MAMFGMTGHLLLVPNQVAMFVAYMDIAGHTRATIRTYVLAMTINWLTWGTLQPNFG